MTSDEVRSKYIEFFKSAPRNHKEIPPSPIVLEDDPTTLFTSAGMQQLVPYLSGEKIHPEGKRLVNSQPCFRANDLEEVGDTSHTTLFEMLGNWSLGDYFKEEEIPWLWEFLTKELGLPKERLYITVFEGSDEVPKDEEAVGIWKSLGIPEEKIFYYGVSDNWWSRFGGPSQMPSGEIGGPSTEVFYEFESVEHDPRFGEKCHPNCDCSKFLEIANSVFIQYRKNKDGALEELPQKNVDHGAGLERLLAATNDDPDVFKTDIFDFIIRGIEEKTSKKYTDYPHEFRVIADHMRAAGKIIENGVAPSNKLHGYILRRLIRRSAVKMRGLKGGLQVADLDFGFEEKTAKVIEEEVKRFIQTLDKGLEMVGTVSPFDLFQSYGFPPELTDELLRKEGKSLDWDEFEKEKEKHKELSKQGSTKKFKKEK